MSNAAAQITRTDAEACRREAIRLQRLPALSLEQVELHRSLVDIWNTFCAQEQARIDAAKRTPEFPIADTYARLRWS